MSRHSWIARTSVIAVIAILATATLAVGQAPSTSPQEAPVLDGIRQTYQAAARGWLPRLVPVAQRLFVLLAGIEFTLSGAVWALRRESLDEVAGKFLLKFTLIAFLLALITSFQYWISPLVNGFAAAKSPAASASGCDRK